MKLSVYTGSLVDPAIGAHAVVNASNPSVALGSGVSGALREACGGTAFQQELRDFVMAIGRRRVECVTTRRDAFLGQVRVGAAFQEELYDFEVPASGGIFDRRAGSNVIAVVVGKAIDQ